jgi:acetylornithine deacetylase
MELFELTRRLIEIDSTTGREADVAYFLAGYLRQIGAKVEVEEAAPNRPNVFASFAPAGQCPVVTLSTHIDTVPPYIPFSEDEEYIHGRGSCDAKGIVAAQVKAAERLRERGQEHLALLFLVGEEKDSAGAALANQHPRGSRFLIDGEPTGNQLAAGSKGALRPVFEAHGRMAHSAYPELGESAIEKLLTALVNLRAIPLPSDELLGGCTYNIGTIEGGRAPNVIPDYARAELLFRLVGPSEALKEAIERAAAGLADVRYVLEIPAMRFETMEGFPSTVVSFTTDIPALGNWGRPYLVGPGSVLEAHTDHERVAKRELAEAVELYSQLAERLLKA